MGDPTEMDLAVVIVARFRSDDGSRRRADCGDGGRSRHRDQTERPGFTSSGNAETVQAFLDATAAAVVAKEQAVELRDYLVELARGR